MTKHPTQEQIVKELNKGPESWNAWRQLRRSNKKTDVRLDMGDYDYTGFNFSHYDLTDIIFDHAILDKCKFIGADISDAKFMDAHLVGATLRVKNGERALFSGAILHNADFSGSNFKDAVFFLADAPGANFRNTDLDNSFFDSSTLTESIFDGAILRNAKLGKAKLNLAFCISTNFENANLVDAILESTTFQNAYMPNVDLRGANLNHAALIETELEGASLQNADFTGAELATASFARADLTGATIRAEQLMDSYVYPTTILDKALETRLDRLMRFVEKPQEFIDLDTESVSETKSLDDFQVLRTKTPIPFIKSDGSTQTVLLESIVVPFWNRRNSLEELFMKASASLVLSQDTRAFEHYENWLETLTKSWLEKKDQANCFEAISYAMENRFIVPYYNCVDWLTLDKLNLIKNGLLFCKDFGEGKPVTGAFKIGACVVIISISAGIAKEVYSPSETTQRIGEAFGNRIIAMIEDKANELEDS